MHHGGDTVAHGSFVAPARETGEECENSRCTQRPSTPGPYGLHLLWVTRTLSRTLKKRMASPAQGRGCARAAEVTHTALPAAASPGLSVRP